VDVIIFLDFLKLLHQLPRNHYVNTILRYQIRGGDITMTMPMNKTLKLMAVPALLAMMVVSATIPVQAHNNNNRYYNARDYRYRGGFSQQSPYLHKALIGGGAGAFIGGLLGQDGYRTGSAVKGAVIGAGAGLGYEYLKRQGNFGGNRNRW
jgi:hypothetical protein